MTEEQKKALINRCKNRITFYKAAGNTGTFDADSLQLTEIALAALTAQPIKLPKQTSYRSPDGEKYELYHKEDMINAIRAAGYQVEGE